MELKFRAVENALKPKAGGAKYGPIIDALEKLTNGSALEIDIPEEIRKTDFRAAIYSAIRSRGFRVRTRVADDRSQIWVWNDGRVNIPQR